MNRSIGIGIAYLARDAALASLFAAPLFVLVALVPEEILPWLKIQVLPLWLAATWLMVTVVVTPIFKFLPAAISLGDARLAFQGGRLRALAKKKGVEPPKRFETRRLGLAMGLVLVVLVMLILAAWQTEPWPRLSFMVGYLAAIVLLSRVAQPEWERRIIKAVGT